MLPMVAGPDTKRTGIAAYREVFYRESGFEHVGRYITGLILNPNKTAASACLAPATTRVSISPHWFRIGASATPAHRPYVGCFRVFRHASTWGQGRSGSAMGSALSRDQYAPCGLIVSARRRDVRVVGVTPSR